MASTGVLIGSRSTGLPMRSVVSLPDQAASAIGLTTRPDGGAELSGGYAWLAAAAFVLLIVGSVGRIIGMRMLYKNRKARKDRETDGL